MVLLMPFTSRDILQTSSNISRLYTYFTSEFSLLMSFEIVGYTEMFPPLPKRPLSPASVYLLIEVNGVFNSGCARLWSEVNFVKE